MSDWREDRLIELIGQLREVEPDGKFGHGATIDEDLTALVSIAESAARRLSEIAKDAQSLLLDRSIAKQRRPSPPTGQERSSLAVDASRIIYFSRWGEVARLRQEAGDYAVKGDTLAAAMLDNQASTLAEKLRAEDAEEYQRASSEAGPEDA